MDSGVLDDEIPELYKEYCFVLEVYMGHTNFIARLFRNTFSLVLVLTGLLREHLDFLFVVHS